MKSLIKKVLIVSLCAIAAHLGVATQAVAEVDPTQCSTGAGGQVNEDLGAGVINGVGVGSVACTRPVSEITVFVDVVEYRFGALVAWGANRCTARAYCQAGASFADHAYLGPHCYNVRVYATFTGAFGNSSASWLMCT